jgi:hypothetical protein
MSLQRKRYNGGYCPEDTGEDVQKKDSSEIFWRTLGVSALVYFTMSAAALTHKYFNPNYFADWKGDYRFIVPKTDWQGWIRCKDDIKEVFLMKDDGKILPLEDALFSVSKESGKRDMARRSVLDYTDVIYSCPE